MSRTYLLAALTASLFIGPAFGGGGHNGGGGNHGGGYSGGGGGGHHGGGGGWNGGGHDDDDDDDCGNGGNGGSGGGHHGGGGGNGGGHHGGGGWGGGHDDDDDDCGDGGHHGDDDDCDGGGHHGGDDDCDGGGHHGDDDCDDGHHDGGDCGGGEPGDCEPPATFCDAGCYDVENPSSWCNTQGFGLVVDGLFGDAGQLYTFGFETYGTGLELCYDGSGRLTLSGRAYGGRMVCGHWDSQAKGYLDIDYTLQGAACAGDALLVLASEGGSGFGSFTWVSTGETFFVTGLANDQGQVFSLDHTWGTDARGWVQGDALQGAFAMKLDGNWSCPPVADCDGDGTPDDQEADCDQNGVPDDCEPEADCDQNGIPDVCDIANGAADADGNGVLDVCEPGVQVFCTGDLDPITGNGEACPCGNLGGPGEGCANSTGFGTVLSANGSVSIAAADLTLHVEGAVPNQPGVYFASSMAANGGQGVVFLDGLRCLDGTIVRLGKVSDLVNGSADYPFGAAPPLALQLGAAPGDITYFQFWYRDPNGCGNGANTSNGLRVIWAQ